MSNKAKNDMGKYGTYGPSVPATPFPPPASGGWVLRASDGRILSVGSGGQVAPAHDAAVYTSRTTARAEMLRAIDRIMTRHGAIIRRPAGH